MLIVANEGADIDREQAGVRDCQKLCKVQTDFFPPFISLAQTQAKEEQSKKQIKKNLSKFHSSMTSLVAIL